MKITREERKENSKEDPQTRKNKDGILRKRGNWALWRHEEKISDTMRNENFPLVWRQVLWAPYRMNKNKLKKIFNLECILHKNFAYYISQTHNQLIYTVIYDLKTKPIFLKYILSLCTKYIGKDFGFWLIEWTTNYCFKHSYLLNHFNYIHS